jgi:hypothetical protein
MPETAFELGDESGRRFKEATIDQLEALANKLGVRTASLSTGSAYLQTDSGRNLVFEKL